MSAQAQVETEIENAQTEALEADAWGKQLAAIRKVQGLLAEDVAAQLRLELRLIEALENEELDQLPLAPFVKGYLRSYARLLEVEADSIVEAFDRTCREQGVGVRQDDQEKNAEIQEQWSKYVTWGLIAAVVLSIFFWLMNRQTTSIQQAGVAPAQTQIPAQTPVQIPAQSQSLALPEAIAPEETVGEEAGVVEPEPQQP